jgi:hypothetical protein
MGEKNTNIDVEFEKEKWKQINDKSHTHCLAFAKVAEGLCSGMIKRSDLAHYCDVYLPAHLRNTAQAAILCVLDRHERFNIPLDIESVYGSIACAVEANFILYEQDGARAAVQAREWDQRKRDADHIRRAAEAAFYGRLNRSRP